MDERMGKQLTGEIIRLIKSCVRLRQKRLQKNTVLGYLPHFVRVLGRLAYGTDSIGIGIFYERFDTFVYMFHIAER